MGGGSSGPSAQDIAAEDQAAAARAQSQTNLMTEQQNIEKQRANEAAVKAAAAQANASSLLAQQNEQLIAGVAGTTKTNAPANPTANPTLTGNVLTSPAPTTAAAATPSTGKTGV